MQIVEKILKIPKTKDASISSVGGEIVITDSYKHKLKDVEIGGNTYQTTYTGKNKLVYPYDISSYSKFGLTATINVDGTILLNGTTTDICYLNLVNTNRSLSAGTYILSGFPTGITQMIRLRTFNGDEVVSVASDTGSGVEFTIAEGETYKMYIQINAGQTLTNVLVKPMIRLASVTDDTYEPYVRWNT